MRTLAFTTAFAALLFAGAAAQAASFDCAKAKSRSELMVCQDPDLPRLDSQMMADYQATLAVTPRPVTERMTQRQWVFDRDKGAADGSGKYVPLTADEMKGRYRDRIKEMADERAVVAKAQAPFPVADLATRCAPLDIEKCKVEASGGVKGPAALGPLWFQVQGPVSDDEFRRGVVVFTAAGPGMVRPLMWNFNDGAHFEEPELIHSADGWLLHLGATDDGTGVFNEDILFHQVAGRWRDIDIVSWSGELDQHLPPDRQVWKGVPYDFAKLETTTGLWKPGDGNCCPTGGQAAIKFHIVGDKMAITSVKVSKKNLE